MGPEKVEYWRSRMLAKWDQFHRGYQFHFKDIREKGVHVDLEDKDINAAILKVEEGLLELNKAISEAKVKKAK